MARAAEPRARAATAATGRAPRATTRHLLSREERQASILRAAATAFARTGFAATSMEDVAAAAGVTKLIVYRHFESKEELYRAVLTEVSEQLRDQFLSGISLPDTAREGFAARAILAVAREYPDGFRLLTLHAAREPQFVDELDTFRDRGIALADLLIGETIPDPFVKAWATRVIVDYLVQAVHAWLDVGEPARDDEFVLLATDGLRAMFLTWADRTRLTPRLRRAVADLQRTD